MNSKNTYDVEIKESHLDTFGHVNNAAYLEIYEESRWDFLTRGGYGLKEIHELKKGPIILDINMRLRKEICNREKIKITFKILKNMGKIIMLEQKMIKEDGTVASEAEFKIGFFDLKERKLIRPTDKWLTTVDSLNALNERPLN